MYSIKEMTSSFIFHYGIPLMNYVSDKIKLLYNSSIFYYKSINSALNSDILYFYEKNPTAYIGSFIDPHNINNGVITWKYSRSAMKFFQYSCLYKDVKHFPIISAYIALDGTSLFILDNFISEIVIERTNADYPTLQQVLEVWAYSTGIILDRTKAYTLCYLDTHLNEHTKNIYTENFTFPTKN